MSLITKNYSFVTEFLSFSDVLRVVVVVVVVSSSQMRGIIFIKKKFISETGHAD